MTLSLYGVQGTTGFPKGCTLSHHNIVNNGFFTGLRLNYENVVSGGIVSYSIKHLQIA